MTREPVEKIRRKEKKKLRFWFVLFCSSVFPISFFCYLFSDLFVFVLFLLFCFFFPVSPFRPFVVNAVHFSGFFFSLSTFSFFFVIS